MATIQEALIFTDDNEQLRAQYARAVRTGSIALICVGVLSGLIAVLGITTVLMSGFEEDDPLFITLFGTIGLAYGLLSVQKWAHISFLIATVLNVIMLLLELVGTGAFFLEGVNASSLIMFVVTLGQIAVTAFTIRGLQFARKLRKLRFEIGTSLNNGTEHKPTDNSGDH